MEILCTLSFLSVMVLLVAVVYMICHIRAEQKRRLEADDALFKMLSGVSEQFSSLVDALAAAGVVERVAQVAKGVSLERSANLSPDQLAQVDAFAAQRDMTREEALVYLARQGFAASVGQAVVDHRRNEAHCKGPRCDGDVGCPCTCAGCRRARRAN